MGWTFHRSIWVYGFKIRVINPNLVERIIINNPLKGRQEDAEAEYCETGINKNEAWGVTHFRLWLSKLRMLFLNPKDKTVFLFCIPAVEIKFLTMKQRWPSLRKYF